MKPDEIKCQRNRLRKERSREKIIQQEKRNRTRIEEKDKNK